MDAKLRNNTIPQITSRWGPEIRATMREAKEWYRTYQVAHLVASSGPAPPPLISTPTSTRPLRVPAGIAPALLAHQDSKALCFFLDLKRLYVDSIIRNEGGVLPYERIANMLKLSKKTVEKRIKILQKHGLILIDDFKDIRLMKYKTFSDIFRKTPEQMRQEQSRCNQRDRKHTIYEVKKTYFIGEYGGGKRTPERKEKYFFNGEMAVKAVAIKENFHRQKYEVKKKLQDNFLKNIIAERLINQRNALKAGGCLLVERTVKAMSKQEKNRLLRYVDFEKEKEKAKRIFISEKMNQTFSGYPEINPHVTLSCTGTAKLFNRESSSTGYYQQQRLKEAGMIEVASGASEKVSKHLAAMECIAGRGEIYGYMYPQRRKRPEQLYFLRLCNNLSMKF